MVSSATQRNHGLSSFGTWTYNKIKSLYQWIGRRWLLEKDLCAARQEQWADNAHIERAQLNSEWHYNVVFMHDDKGRVAVESIVIYRHRPNTPAGELLSADIYNRLWVFFVQGLNIDIISGLTLNGAHQAMGQLVGNQLLIINKGHNHDQVHHQKHLQ